MFILSAFITTCVSLLVMRATHAINFASISHLFTQYPALASALWWFCVVNNSYQVVSHVLTAIKFYGWQPVYIPGAADEQAVSTFGVFNQLDLWGWWAYFIYSGACPLWLNFLSAVHCGVAVTSVVLPKTFQQNYIVPGGGPLFTFSKASFVLLDAVSRATTVWIMTR